MQSVFKKYDFSNFPELKNMIFSELRNIVLGNQNFLNALFFNRVFLVSNTPKIGNGFTDLNPIDLFQV